MRVKVERVGCQDERQWGERDTGRKKELGKSKNVNASSSCGLNKRVIVREDYTSVLQHHPPTYHHHQMENLL